MAYGLPSRGQADWDDELNNSIEALRGTAERAEADATVARSTAVAASAKVDGYVAPTPEAVSHALQNDEGVQDSLDATMADRVGSGGPFDSALSASYARVFGVPEPTGDGLGLIDLDNIQDTIDACSLAGGGIVLLQPGVYELESHLLMKSGVWLRGAAIDATTVRLRNSGGGNAVIQNASWNAGPTSWSTTETDYAVTDLTLDANVSGTSGFRYVLAFQRFARVTVERVHVKDSDTGSGLFFNNGTDLTVRFNRASNVGGNGIYLSNVVGFDVSGNNVISCGDFGIEIGAGYDFGHAGGTGYGGDGTVIGNRTTDCVNYGIALRGYDDATANPNNHYVQNVVVDDNFAADCGLAPYKQYEFTRDITLGAGNNFIHTGTRQRLQRRITDDLAAVDFTSGATGAWTDFPLDQSFTPICDMTARIYLRARFTAGATGTYGLKGVIANSAPIAGRTTVTDVRDIDSGKLAQLTVCWEVQLEAEKPYQIKAQFFNGGGGTLTIAGDVESTDMLIVLDPLA